MKLFLRIWLLLLTAAFFTACGGGGGGDGDPTLLTPEDNGSNDNASDAIIRFGISSGGVFVDGAMSASSNNIAEGENAVIQVTFVDENGAPANVPADVTFNSTCIAAGTSLAQPQTVTNSNGLVSTTYTANGCNIEDNIIASTEVNGVTLSANVAVQTSSDSVGDGEPNTDTDVRFGTFQGGQFQDGQIKANFTNLQPGDTVSIEASLIDAAGLPYTEEVAVTLNSTCVSAGLATITPAEITTNSGLVQTEYNSQGCTGEDRLIAVANVDGTNLTADVVLTTQFNSRFGNYVGGIFSSGLLSTTASNLKTGATAAISVKLESQQGSPVAGNEVRFSSSKCVGPGLSTITNTAITDDSGIATAQYTANGCSGEDIVIAETRYAGQNLSATTTLTIDPLVIRFGSFDQIIFNEGDIASSISDVISAGESTTLTVALIDQNNALYNGAATVFFNSPCISDGLAEIEPAVAENNGGTATIVYTARGCDGTDTVTASTFVADNTFTASVVLTTDQPPLGTIQFMSATPQIIGIKGTESINDIDNEDGREIGAQSVVVFKVTSSAGNALPNHPVSFSLVSGDSGSGNDGPDAFLSVDSAISDNDGLVSTVVNPGTDALPVRVRATTTHEGADASAVSNSLVITTGIPDQDSFSLSASCLNPDSWAYNGVTTTITAHLADRFNNPVPDGTTVTFRTEGGSIEASCQTGTINGTGGSPHGECSVSWRSQNPRPVDGRISILATAVGEESFLDVSPTNGRFDDAEFSAQHDIGEPFLDENENGVFDPGTEEFADFNLNGQWDGPNGFYDGLLCNKNDVNTQCNSTSETVYVYDNITLIMADGTALNVELRESTDPLSPLVSNLDLDNGAAIVYAHVFDPRSQIPPGGTTISISTEVGDIVGPASYTVPSTSSNAGRFIAPFVINPADDLNEAATGLVEVTVTSGTCAGGTAPSSSTISGVAAVSQSPTP